MPNDNIVEKLSIEIVSQTSKATNELGKVVGELEKLRSVLSGIKMPNMNMGLKQSTADNLKKLADVIYDLKLDKLKAFGDVASGISFKIGINDKTADNLLSFNEAVKSFDANKLKEFASAASATPKLNLGINGETGLNLRSFAAALQAFPVPKLAELGAVSKYFTPINLGAKSDTGGNLRSLGDALNAFPMPKLAELGAVSKYFTKLNIGVQADTGKNLQSLGQSLSTFPMPKLAELGAVSKYYTKLDLGISATTAKNLASFASSIADLDIQKLEQLARINFSNLAVLGEASAKLQGLNGALETLSKTADRVEKAQKKLASSTRSVHRETRTSSHTFNLANTALGKLFNSIKRIAFYRVIRSAIKSVTQGFAEGIENLYRWSQAWGTSFAPAMDQLKTAQTYLKNGFASMFSPLIEYATPIIDRLVNKLVDMFNAVQELFAQLTGAATWNKAIKYPVKYKDDLDAAAGSAKALQNILMDFDEINAINTPNAGSRGSGKEAEDYSKMFELVQTSTKSDSALGKFIESLNKLNFEPLKNSLKNLWNDGINPILNYFKENGGKFLSPLVQFFVEEGLPTAINLVTASLKPFLDIVKPLFDSGFFEDIAGKLSKVNASVQKFADFFSKLDFSPIGEALSSLWNNTLSPIIDKLIVYADFIREKVIQPITQFLVEKGIPAAIGSIESAISAIWSILEPILDGLQTFWSENGGWIMELFEGQTMTALGKIKEAFKAIGDFFKKNGDKIRSIFSNLSKVIKDLSPAIKKIVEMIGTSTWDSFVDTIRNILTLLQPILDLASGIVNLLTAHGDKEKAKQGLKEIGQAIWDGLKAPFEIVLRVLASVLDTIGHIFPGCKEAAHAIRVLIGDEVEEVNEKVRVGNELITKSEKKVDEYGNYVSVTGKKISAAQDEINQKRAEEIKKVQELGVTNSDMAREMTEWYNYCTEQGLEPMTGQIIFTAEQARILGVAVQGVATSANSISVKPVTTLDDAFKYLVTDVQKMSPVAKTAFTQSEQYMQECKKWGIDPLTGAILDLQRDANGLPYKLKPGFTSIQEYASATAAHVKTVFKDALSNKNGNTFGADFGRGFADALKSALERTNFSAAIDIQEVTHQTIVQYKKQVNLDYEGQKMMMRGFASGGFPEQGSLFYAGEGSAELLGTVGGRTAVAGEKEITGIRDAIVEQGQREEGLLRQLISAVANKDLTLVANSKTGRWVNQSLRAYAGVTG